MDLLTMYAIKNVANQAPIVLEMGENSQGVARAVNPLPTYIRYQVDGIPAGNSCRFSIDCDLQLVSVQVIPSTTDTLRTQIYYPDSSVQEINTPVYPGELNLIELPYFMLPAGCKLDFALMNGTAQFLQALGLPVILHPPKPGILQSVG